MALALKTRHGGAVSLLSMGPPFFERYLRLGLAMGADSAYLMSDRAFGGAGTPAPPTPPPLPHIREAGHQRAPLPGLPEMGLGHGRSAGHRVDRRRPGPRREPAG